MLLFSRHFSIIHVTVLLSLATFACSSSTGHLSYAPEYDHPEYAFSYGVKDMNTGDVKSQWESRDNGITKGHYSVLEPDGSIRTVDYTADSKNGFNAVVKTHGPNIHPIMESEHIGSFHNTYELSQSKINHYSKNQGLISINSNLDLTEEHSEREKYVKPSPPIIEIKQTGEPEVHYGKNIETPERPADTDNYESSEEGRLEIKSIPAPDLSKFKPISVNGGFGSDQEPWKAVISDETVRYYEDLKEKETPTEPQATIHIVSENYPRQQTLTTLNTNFIASQPIFAEELTPSFSQPSKFRGKLHTTPGLRHFGTLNKLKKFKRGPTKNVFPIQFSRKPKRFNRHTEGPLYFGGDVQEQRLASSRIVQSMLQQDRKHIMPNYASYNSDHYF